jgi:hypothetical protein
VTTFNTQKSNSIANYNLGIAANEQLSDFGQSPVTSFDQQHVPQYAQPAQLSPFSAQNCLNTQGGDAIDPSSNTSVSHFIYGPEQLSDELNNIPMLDLGPSSGSSDSRGRNPLSDEPSNPFLNTDIDFDKWLTSRDFLDW